MSFNHKGFTLVELLIYVAILTLLLSGIIPFLLDMSASRAKHYAQVDLYSQMRYVTEKIKSDIRNANSYNGPAAGANCNGSSFNTNIAANSSTRCLSLHKYDLATGVSYDIFYGISNNALQVSRDGGVTWYPITSPPVTVTSFILFNNSDSGSSPTTLAVGFTITMVENNSAVKTTLKESMSVTSGAVMRSNPY